MQLVGEVTRLPHRCGGATLAGSSSAGARLGLGLGLGLRLRLRLRLRLGLGLRSAGARARVGGLTAGGVATWLARDARLWVGAAELVADLVRGSSECGGAAPIAAPGRSASDDGCRAVGDHLGRHAAPWVGG